MKALAPGTLVAERYRIVGTLGRGGMGHVYRAEHVGLHKQVALKVVAGSAVDQLTARFEREAHALARLDHPGCVRVLDYGAAGGAPYLAMELVEGETLAAALLERGPFSPRRAVAIARALLGALSHAHARGVLHRDLKPENVILAAGRPVLIDFGLASVRDAGPLTATGMCIGSPSYIAPERLLGEPHTERSDVYSIGVLLFEMLAGAPPFLGRSAEEIVHAVLHMPPRPLRAHRAGISAPLEAIVRRALARDPAHRHADADEMRAALDELAVLEILAAAEAEAAQAEADEQADAARTLAIDARELERCRPSPVARLWSWLRFGRWRRRDLRRLAAAAA